MRAPSDRRRRRSGCPSRRRRCARRDSCRPGCRARITFRRHGPCEPAGQQERQSQRRQAGCSQRFRGPVASSSWSVPLLPIGYSVGRARSNGAGSDSPFTSMCAGDAKRHRLQKRGLERLLGQRRQRVARHGAVMARALDCILQRSACAPAARWRGRDRPRRYRPPPACASRNRDRRWCRAGRRARPAASPFPRGNRRRRPCRASGSGRRNRARRRSSWKAMPRLAP